MCEAKDFPPSECDELMGLVTQLQGQVAQLTAAKEDVKGGVIMYRLGGGERPGVASMVSENDAPIDVKPRVRFPRLSSEGPRILRELRSV